MIPNWEDRYYKPEGITIMQRGLHKVENQANKGCINIRSCTWGRIIPSSSTSWVGSDYLGCSFPEKDLGILMDSIKLERAMPL